MGIKKIVPNRIVKKWLDPFFGLRIKRAIKHAKMFCARSGRGVGVLGSAFYLEPKKGVKPFCNNPIVINFYNF